MVSWWSILVMVNMQLWKSVVSQLVSFLQLDSTCFLKSWLFGEAMENLVAKQPANQGKELEKRLQASLAKNLASCSPEIFWQSFGRILCCWGKMVAFLSAMFHPFFLAVLATVAIIESTLWSLLTALQALEWFSLDRHDIHQPHRAAFDGWRDLRQNRVT